ncbi:MAG: cation diffusion facilitator family transporter [Acidobacteriota bacterium]
MSASSKSALALSLGANVGIAASKFVVYGLTHSASMLTEAIHSLADSGNQVLLFIGMKKAEQAPTEKHPLGLGQAAFVASFLVALLLFSVGGLYSVVEGIHKIRHPEAPHQLGYAIGLLIFSVILESISMRGALKVANEHRGKKSLLAYMRESSSTELVVVLAEDAAALLGLTIALVAVLLTMVTGNPIWDGIGSLLIGLLLVGVAWFVGYEVASLLLNESAPPGLRRRLEELVAADGAVEECLNVVAVVVGSDRVMVALKVRFKETGSGQALVEAINALERRLKKEMPQIQHLFVEPDLEA